MGPTFYTKCATMQDPSKRWVCSKRTGWAGQVCWNKSRWAAAKSGTVVRKTRLISLWCTTIIVSGSLTLNESTFFLAWGKVNIVTSGWWGWDQDGERAALTSCPIPLSPHPHTISGQYSKVVFCCLVSWRTVADGLFYLWIQTKRIKLQSVPTQLLL